MLLCATAEPAHSVDNPPLISLIPELDFSAVLLSFEKNQNSLRGRFSREMVHLGIKQKQCALMRTRLQCWKKHEINNATR